MNLELIIKDVSGKVIAKHSLVSTQPLSLTPPAGASTFEVHSNDGNLPPQIKATKSSDGLKLTWVDETTDEKYEVLLENYAPDTPPAITASGPDGAVYAFDYDTTSAVYELTDTSAETLIADSNSVMLAAGGSFAAAALAIGIGVSNHSSDGGDSDDNDNSTSDRNTALTDDSGNIIRDGDTISDGTPTFGGSGMLPGSVVTISDNGTVIGEAIVDENGRWSFTPDEALADGSHAIVIEGTDADGNPTRESVNVVVDTQGDGDTGSNGEDNDGSEGVTNPENGLDDGSEDPGSIAPVMVVTDDDGNVISSGAVTRDSTPTFSGSNYLPGSTVTLSEGTLSLGQTTVDESGYWTFTPEALPEGVHGITVTGAASNGAGSSNGFDLVIDVTAPEVVDGAAVVITDENGNAIEPGTPSANATPTFSGDGAEPGATVVVSDGDEVIGEAVVGEDGSWSFTPDEPLAEGDHDISFEVVDEAGNGSGASEPIDYTVDTTAPEAVDGAAVVITDENGNVIEPGTPSASTTPTFSGGGAEPGATVVVSDGDEVIGEAVVDEDGSWSFTPDEPLAEGDHDISFEVVDEAGNGSGASDPISYPVDTTAPESIDTAGVTITDEAGNVIEPGNATQATTPTFSGGGAEPGATVVVSDGDTIIGEAVVGEDGSWSLTPDEPLAEGDHDISFEVVDEAGNGSGASDPIDYVVDTTAPEAVDGAAVVITDEAGNVIEPGSATQATTPTFSGGGAEPGATVVVSDGDTIIGEAVVDEDGSWSLTPDEPLAEGDHAISFEVVDEAGNGSGASEPIDYTVDTTAPEAVDGAAVVITDENGNAIEPGTPSANATPTFSGGGAEPGATVVVSDGDEVIGEAVVGEDGSWSFMPDEPLAEGDHDISFEVVDEAGNGSGASAPIDYVVDTTAPESIDTAGVTITDEAGNVIEPGSATQATAPTFSGGGAEPGATVVVSDGDTIIGEAVVGEDGSWSLTPDEPLAEGDHAISFEVVDEAGNGSGASDPIDYVVDTTAPEAVDGAAVVITDEAGDVIDPGSATQATTPTFSGGGAEPGATVVVSDGDTIIGEAVVGEDGSWSLTPDEPLAEGDHAISFEVVDEAGNGSGASAPIDYVVDTTAPESIDTAGVTITDEAGNVIDPGSATQATAPTFSGGGAEPGATVVVSDGDEVIGEAVVGEDGSWSFTPDEPLAEGDHDISFEVVDEAGNGSGASAPIDYVVDTTAPESIDTAGVTITDEAGNVIEPGSATQATTPTFSGGGAEPGATVVVSDGDTIIGEAVVGEDGSWSVTPDEPLAEGDHDISFEAVDEAGNGSGASDPIDYVVDTTAPEAVDGAAVVITDEAGNVIEPGSATQTTTPTFSGGGAEPGATVVVSDGDEVIGEAVVDEDGSWSLTPDEPLAEGDHAISFEVVDEAGNGSGASEPISYPVDTTAPEGVDISAVVITDEVGNTVDSTQTLTDSKATFSGSDLEPGATVTLYDKGEIIGQATVADDGSWRFTDEEGLYNGSHELTFTVTDEAGNSSEPSDTLSLEVQAIILTAVDNINTGAAIGFTYPVDVAEDLGTLINDSGFLELNKSITSDPIVVADGTVIDLEVVGTSSSFLNIASNATLVLQKYVSSTGEWTDISENDSSNLFGMFGSGATSSTLTLTGLSAGSYRLVYTVTGLNLGAGFELEAAKTVYTLADEATTTDYTTATGNIISDEDSAYGADSIPHSASTLVSSISVTDSSGKVTSKTLGSLTKTSLVGKYGMLIISSDGSYEYIPDTSMENIGKVETYTYTLTDSATGATSSAHLYIQIGTSNDALTLSWDATEPGTDAVTDIASSDVADASVTVTYRTAEVSDTSVILTAGGTANYSSTFTLAAAEDLVSGVLTLKTESGGLFGNQFATDKTIVYDIQQLGEDGSWTTLNSYTLVVPAGQHNNEVLLTLDISTLVEGAGTYRIAIVTTGADNNVILNMEVTVVSTTDYEITASQTATGNLLLDEGADGGVDKLSSIYTRMYAKAGDGTADTDVDSSYTAVTESGVTLVGEYGTLLLYSDGTYIYTPDATTLPSGSQDIFTYALKGANGEVVNATLSINLGVEVDGSSGGALVFQGTEVDDVFDVYDTDFALVDGAEGTDTLAWHGNGELVLSDIADKVANIEAVSLTSTTDADRLIVTAQSVSDVTSQQNSLYIRGESGNTVTLAGSWLNSGTVVVDSLIYTHYTSTTENGAAVDIYLQQGIALSDGEWQTSLTGEEYDVASAAEVVGTDNDDLFNVSSTDFASIDGGDGFDTLEWSGTGTLTLKDIASKIGNIEEIDLVNDSSVNTLVITAQNVADITDDNNTLYVKGSITDKLTLSGSWTLAGSEVVNNVDYLHYTSETADGQRVDLYVDSDITSSGVETASETDAAQITGQVELLSDSLDQTTTLKSATGSFTSDEFTVNSATDLQNIHINVYTAALMNANNSMTVNWSLQVYNSQTYSWDKVTEGSKNYVRTDSSIDVTLSGQQAGTYRVVVDYTQTGYTGVLWTTQYDELTVKVSAEIVSTSDYRVTASSSSAGSVFTSDAASDGSLLVKSIAAGIVAGSANYTLVTEAGTTLGGTYGSLTIHSDGSYTYTLNSDSVIKLSGSEDAFTYVLSDGTTHNLTMTLGVAVDGSNGGALTFAGTVGEDSFAVYDTDFTTLDGKDGHDTLIWRGATELQLSEIADKVSNIEAIDLQNNGTAAVLVLSADDIVNVTDDGNALYVRGGSEDSLSLQGSWIASGVETLNNLTYTLYSGTALDGTAVSLYVQQGLSFNELTETLSGSLSAEALQQSTVIAVSQNGETAVINEDAATLKGAWGTLTLDGAGHYSYVPDEGAEQSGTTDTFTYTLSDGSSASLSFNLGVTVDGSAGGDITFSGSGGSDIFQVYDTDFTSINGADGSDTLAWYGSGSLNLSYISARVSNIEAVDLLDDSVSDNLIISAESLLKITDDSNTLYVRGAEGDTVTLNGSWEQSSTQLVNGVHYEHYTSTTADGSVVQLYVEDDVVIG